MNSILSVTAAASDLTLLTTAELRGAVGLDTADGSKDASLKILGVRIAALITQACRVPADGATTPTLRLETLTETFRPEGWRRGICWRDRGNHDDELILARRPLVAVSSVQEGAVTLTEATDYVVDGGTGILRRVINDLPASWLRRSTIIVQYQAGWNVVPDGLKMAAEQLARVYWFQNSRDPALKQISVPGVIERQYWVGAASDPAVPQDVIDMLGPYRNLLIG